MPTSTEYTVGNTPKKIRTGTPGIAGMLVTPAAAIRISGADVSASNGTLLAAGERADLPAANWQAQSVSGSNVSVMVTEYEGGE